MNIDGMTAIVTGGGSGLGEAAARALSQKGARVAVLDRDHAKASAVASGIGGIALECDVADAQSAEAAVNAVAEQLGTARILINSAGIVAVRRTLSREGP